MGGCLAGNFKKGQAPIAMKPSKKAHANGVHELKQNYRISSATKVLGAGAFGKVFLSESIANPGFKVAIKVLNKAKLKDHINAIREEVRILTKLDHPNIVKYYETYDDTKYMYLVMENCPGGELFDKIACQKNQIFVESEAAIIMAKLLRAINHCHASGVVHRDIKPENVMYGQDGEIKLIDFGLSKRVSDKYTQLTTVAGTPYYMAPEVIDGEYTQQCDIWSLGVLMYVLLSGYLPFQDTNRLQVFKLIKKGHIHFNHQEFLKVSNEGKELITKMLAVDPKVRVTADQALKHPWFDKFKNIEKGCEEDKLDPHILQRLREYRGVSALKKTAMNILVKMADNKDIENLRNMFMRLDKDQTGYINANELRDALNEAAIKFDEKELDNIISEVDYHGEKRINYSEFLAATISVKKILTDEKLKAIFNSFDVEQSGKITKQNIYEAMVKLGRHISKKEIEEIMEKHDFLKDGFITLEEFRDIFKSSSADLTNTII